MRKTAYLSRTCWTCTEKKNFHLLFEHKLQLSIGHLWGNTKFAVFTFPCWKICVKCQNRKHENVVVKMSGFCGACSEPSDLHRDHYTCIWYSGDKLSHWGRGTRTAIHSLQNTMDMKLIYQYLLFFPKLNAFKCRAISKIVFLCTNTLVSFCDVNCK